MEALLDRIDITALMTRLIGYLPQLISGLLVLGGFLLLYRLTRRPFMFALKKVEFHDKLVDLIVNNLYRYTITVLGLVMAADQVGVNVGAALAGIGVVGIAVGFAAQDSVANVISGILIFWDKPFIVGDWIEVEGEYGCVKDITLRTTRIRTPRNAFVVIPNKRIIDAVLQNFSHRGELRLDVPVGIAYKENIDDARAALLGALGEIGTVLSDPAPAVVVVGLGSSSVNLEVRAWIESPSDERATTVAILEASKKALDRAGIQIPFPHLQLFVDDVQERVWDRLGALPALARGSSEGGEARA